MTQPLSEDPFAFVKFWIPVEHACGCIIDWGCDARFSNGWAEEFLPAVAPYACPMHGSTTGTPEPPLREDEFRLLVAHNVFYRAAKESQREDAQRNRALALASPLASPVAPPAPSEPLH